MLVGLLGGDKPRDTHLIATKEKQTGFLFFLRPRRGNFTSKSGSCTKKKKMIGNLFQWNFKVGMLIAPNYNFKTKFKSPVP